jgi:23S rRNA (adenine2503-C2)-methyltransferase
MLELYRLTRQELDQLMINWRQPIVHARTLWSAIYRQRIESLNDLPTLPPKLVQQLHQDARLTNIQLARESAADNHLARKYLLTLADGQTIESVLMHYQERNTVCVSSQVGCALGCVFCATGQWGFRRDLSADEIVAQVLFAQRDLLKRPLGAPVATHPTSNSELHSSKSNRFSLPPLAQRVRNMVLMGMGEPLLNFDEVLRACDILHDPGGFALGAKQITISTVGVIPGIIRLADERRPYSLAVSLHAATQAERAAIVPTARAWPLDELISACRYYAQTLDRRIFFEWTLIAGVNDTHEQANQLGQLLQGLPAHVNLIPLNPTRGYSGESSRDEAAESFQSTLRAWGIPSTVRQRRGIEIAAGCGQLTA